MVHDRAFADDWRSKCAAGQSVLSPNLHLVTMNPISFWPYLHTRACSIFVGSGPTPAQFHAQTENEEAECEFTRKTYPGYNVFFDPTRTAGTRLWS